MIGEPRGTTSEECPVSLSGDPCHVTVELLGATPPDPSGSADRPRRDLFGSGFAALSLSQQQAPRCAAAASGSVSTRRASGAWLRTQEDSGATV